MFQRDLHSHNDTMFYGTEHESNDPRFLQVICCVRLKIARAAIEASLLLNVLLLIAKIICIHILFFLESFFFRDKRNNLNWLDSWLTRCWLATRRWVGLVVSLQLGRVNHEFWSHLLCSGRNAANFSCQGIFKNWTRRNDNDNKKNAVCAF